MRVLKPLTPLSSVDATARAVFLAGSIEMDGAPRWQDELSAALVDTDLVLLNPRRDAWDSSWEQQRIGCEPFREQVHADIVCFL